MININNKNYINYASNISWSNFEITKDNNKINGVSPTISFNIENNIFIEIETTIYNNIYNKFNFNTKTNITKYISDITYKDKDGWISLITENYNCTITKTNKNKFEIELHIKEKLHKKNITITADVYLK